MKKGQIDCGGCHVANILVLPLQSAGMNALGFHVANGDSGAPEQATATGMRYYDDMAYVPDHRPWKNKHQRWNANAQNSWVRLKVTCNKTE